MYTIKGSFAPALITIDDLDADAVTQLYGLLNARAAEGSKVAIMPDGHPGKDCLVGFTQRFGEDAEVRLVPNFVGGDIAREIWETCRRRFFNPCKRTIGVTAKPDGAVLAGVDALAKISALNEDAPTCFAMPLKGFRSLSIEELSPASAPCKLQLWHYPPTVLGVDAIDPASLYLSLQNEPDDRVQIELDKLQETFKW